MKNKHRNIVIILVVIAFLYIVPAWSENSNETKLNVLMPAPFADSTKDLISDFNTANKGRIKVKVTRGPLETESVSDLAISSLLLGKSQYDIILMDVTWLPKYAAAGWLKSIDEYFDEESFEELAIGSSLGNKYNGKLYRWPLVADMGLLYWRKDLMDSPPRTPKELIEISLNLQSKDLVKYGYVWQGRQYEGLSCVFLEVIKGFGGDWVNNQSKVSLNTPESIKAVKWLKKLITSGTSPQSTKNYSENEVLQVFRSGDAAFMRNWPYAWKELQKDSSLVKGNVGVTTMVSEKNSDSKATLGSWGFSIIKDSENYLASAELIKYLTSINAQKLLFVENGYTPTSKATFEDRTLLAEYPVLAELEKALRVTEPRPQIALYAQISDVLQRQISAVLTEQLTPEKAMQIAQKNTERILRSAGESDK